MNKKKTYVQPTNYIMWLQGEEMLSTSGVTSSKGIGFGGIDQEGSLSPSVKENSSNIDWDAST